jgi:hypothetical protein
MRRRASAILPTPTARRATTATRARWPTGAWPGVCTPQGPVRPASNADAVPQKRHVRTPRPALCSHPPRAGRTACNDGTRARHRNTCQAGGLHRRGARDLRSARHVPRRGLLRPDDGPVRVSQLAQRDRLQRWERLLSGRYLSERELRGIVDRLSHGSSFGMLHGDLGLQSANGQCVPRPVPTAPPAIDGDSCTSADSCQAGVCTGTSVRGGLRSAARNGGDAILQGHGLRQRELRACGHACVDSACLRGQCVDGCVIAASATRTASTTLAMTASSADRPVSPHRMESPGDMPRISRSALAEAVPAASVRRALLHHQPRRRLSRPTPAPREAAQRRELLLHADQRRGHRARLPLSTNPCRSTSVGTCHLGAVRRCQLERRPGLHCPRGRSTGRPTSAGRLTTALCVQGTCVQRHPLQRERTCHHVDDPGRGLCFVGVCEGGDCGR